jgi:hypothetical protein
MRGVAVLAAAMLVGGIFAISPATAAKFLTKKKAQKLFYSKAAADARFINLGEKASDADLLDGQDSGAFLTSSSGVNTDELLFAVVNSNSPGTLVFGRGATGVQRFGAGDIQVNFNRDVSQCSTIAAAGGHALGSNSNTGVSNRYVSSTVLGTGSPNNQQVGVLLFNHSGTTEDGIFHLAVIC